MLIERISYNINWRNFKAGYSFFIPCLDPPSAKKVILRVTKRLKIKIITKLVIEEGVKGLRVWRI
tara:strand:- start:123 stop:317 length:195 start_codon:yes stop_codon:yes gene_type:complete